jgi:hypothetical protein
MNLERIDEIIAKNITITDQSLYEGVFNAVLEAVNEENEACAQVCFEMAQRHNDIRSAALEMASEYIQARGDQT